MYIKIYLQSQSMLTVHLLLVILWNCASRRRLEPDILSLYRLYESLVSRFTFEINTLSLPLLRCDSRGMMTNFPLLQVISSKWSPIYFSCSKKNLDKDIIWGVRDEGLSESKRRVVQIVINTNWTNWVKILVSRACILRVKALRCIPHV